MQSCKQSNIWIPQISFTFCLTFVKDRVLPIVLDHRKITIIALHKNLFVDKCSFTFSVLQLERRHKLTAGGKFERKDQKETFREPGENQSFTQSKVLKRGWKLLWKIPSSALMRSEKVGENSGTGRGSPVSQTCSVVKMNDYALLSWLELLCLKKSFSKNMT